MTDACGSFERHSQAFGHLNYDDDGPGAWIPQIEESVHAVADRLHFGSK
jgi:hypothetical protein